MGNKSTTSTSKIKNKIINKKNRKEKGFRIDLIGSKPHSNGDSFEDLGLEAFQRVIKYNNTRIIVKIKGKIQ